MGGLVMKFLRLAFVFCVTLVVFPLSAFGQSANDITVDGFRDLKWGMSIEDAKKIYPDLTVDQTSTYYRNNEDKTIGDVPVDLLIYDFKKNRFNKVHARIISACKDTSKCLAMFRTLKDSLEAKYGRATMVLGDSLDLEWLVGATKITLSGSAGLTSLLLDIENIQSS
jgi:hypothetical protein